MIIKVVLPITFLLCKIQAQVCGPPILPLPAHPPTISNCQILPAPPPSMPIAGTTIIDTSLSSALANVLQLLIVSDLIESTLTTALGHHSVPLPNVNCEPVTYAPTFDIFPHIPEYVPPTCSPVVEFLPPRVPVVDVIPSHQPFIDFIPPTTPFYDFAPQYGPVIDYLPPCAPVNDFIPTNVPMFDFAPQFGPVIDYLPPCAPILDFIPSNTPVFDFISQYGPVIDCKPLNAPIVDFIPSNSPILEFKPQSLPVLEYKPPCGPVYDFVPSSGQYIEPITNCYGEYVHTVPNSVPIHINTPNYCNDYVNPTNVAIFTQPLEPSFVNGPAEFIGPLQMAPLVPNCYNGITEVINPRGNIGPLNTEILLPSAIPAQLKCNVGALPANLPCVSVNVEPLSCGCGYGNSIVGNPYFY